MIIDIVIPVAEQGGVENAIKMLLEHVEKYHNSEDDPWKVRVIQLVWEGVRWLDEGVDFTALNDGKGSYDANEFANQYRDYLEKNGAANLVIASVWPLTSYITKRALSMAGRTDIPVVSWLHAPVEEYERAGFGGYQYLALADIHMAISKYIYDEIQNALPEALVWRVRNPVELNMGEELCDVTPNNIKKLAFIGRISAEKNLEAVIKALGNAPGWCLDIVGSGEDDYVAELKGLASMYSVDECINWYGWQEKPWEYVKDADFVVLASYYEGFPLVAIEAFARGIPIISTPVSGITELVKPDVTGYLFSKGSDVELSAILNALSEGKIGSIDRGLCREIAKKYDKYNALEDMCAKLDEMITSRS